MDRREDVPVGILHLLDRLDDTPAFVMDAKYDILAWNGMAAALITDFSRRPPRERNPLRSFFLSPQSSQIAGDGEYGRFARVCVADLRAAAARYPDDPGVTGLVNELLEGSELFARLWSEREIAVQQSNVKVLRHPLVGPIELHCDVLHVPDRDQRIVLYTAAPGTAAYEALKLLRVVGVQDLASEAALGE